jgi:hypothetical protein
MAAFVLHVPAAAAAAGQGLLFSHTRNYLVKVLGRIKVTLEELISGAKRPVAALRTVLGMFM